MELPIVARANQHVKRTAIIDDGQAFMYRHLLDESAKVATALLNGRNSLGGARVAFMLMPGFAYAATLWGIWRAGGIAVPLALSHPPLALQYTLGDSQASMLIGTHQFLGALAPLAQEMHIAVLAFEEIAAHDNYAELPDVAVESGALLLYTSGTTSQPKGVLISHANLEAQMRMLHEAWRWSANDHILNVLPLHHVHGLVNVLLCALWAGGICEFLPKFEPALAWERFCNSTVNVFMAVPTIYTKLAAYWDEAPDEVRPRMSESLRRFRLMVSGSAALPVPLMEKWGEISGHTLLERYGMTEIGMALSNPYEGVRLPGYVGHPLPSVEIRVVNEVGLPVPQGESGEIQVKGPSVFKGYWNRPEATKETFTEDGWFKTGDLGVFENGSYRILGRISVDIIKSGGYKISALEIEDVLRRHPKIAECAVVGLPDNEWGELVGAMLVASEGQAQLSLNALRDWAKERLPSYKVPRCIAYTAELPKNAMGKVTKPEVKALLLQGFSSQSGQ